MPHFVEMVDQISPKGLEIIVLCAIFLVLTSSCIALRVISRRIKGVGLGADDYFIFSALVSIPWCP